jgi:copper chaperone CopZ
VERAKADHVTGKVEVTYDEDRVGGEQFGRAVEEAGYPLKS